MDATQEALDSFYWKNGPCCAGCDWWHHISPKVGECHRAPIVSGHDRMQALGITFSSKPFTAGHPITERDHPCGEFKDVFDWKTLPQPYRKRIGAPL